MDIEQLRLDLENDESVVHEIYLDHLGFPSFGIGHLIRGSDPEHGLAVGTPVSEARVAQVFEDDIESVVGDCCILYSDFYELPAEAQLVIGNMMFNLGRSRLSKFRGMKAGVDARDWQKAADEMVDSRWYAQVPERAKRLVERMRSI